METINIKSKKDLALAEELIEKYSSELNTFRKKRIDGISVKTRNEKIQGYENVIKELKEKIDEYINPKPKVKNESKNQ